LKLTPVEKLARDAVSGSMTAGSVEYAIEGLISAEMVRLRGALQRIADGGCDCKGYYRCNNCPQRLVSIAEDALSQ
jgi:hypothetical protein